eukprot:gene398-471_t
MKANNFFQTLKVEVMNSMADIPLGLKTMLAEGVPATHPPRPAGKVPVVFSPIDRYAREFAKQYPDVGYLEYDEEGDGEALRPTDDLVPSRRTLMRQQRDTRDYYSAINDDDTLEDDEFELELSQDAFNFANLKIAALKRGLSMSQATTQATRDIFNVLERREIEMNLIRQQAESIGIPSFDPEKHLRYLTKLYKTISDRREEFVYMTHRETLEEVLRMKKYYGETSPLTFEQVANFRPAEFDRFIAEHPEYSEQLSQPLAISEADKAKMKILNWPDEPDAKSDIAIVPAGHSLLPEVAAEDLMPEQGLPPRPKGMSVKDYEEAMLKANDMRRIFFDRFGKRCEDVSAPLEQLLAERRLAERKFHKSDAAKEDDFDEDEDEDDDNDGPFDENGRPGPQILEEWKKLHVMSKIVRMMSEEELLLVQYETGVDLREELNAIYIPTTRMLEEELFNWTRVTPTVEIENELGYVPSDYALDPYKEPFFETTDVFVKNSGWQEFMADIKETVDQGLSNRKRLNAMDDKADLELEALDKRLAELPEDDGPMTPEMLAAEETRRQLWLLNTGMTPEQYEAMSAKELEQHKENERAAQEDEEYEDYEEQEGDVKEDGEEEEDDEDEDEDDEEEDDDYYEEDIEMTPEEAALAKQIKEMEEKNWETTDKTQFMADIFRENRSPFNDIALDEQGRISSAPIDNGADLFKGDFLNSMWTRKSNVEYPVVCSQETIGLMAQSKTLSPELAKYFSKGSGQASADTVATASRKTASLANTFYASDLADLSTVQELARFQNVPSVDQKATIDQAKFKSAVDLSIESTIPSIYLNPKAIIKPEVHDNEAMSMTQKIAEETRKINLYERTISNMAAADRKIKGVAKSFADPAIKELLRERDALLGNSTMDDYLAMNDETFNRMHTRIGEIEAKVRELQEAAVIRQKLATKHSSNYRQSVEKGSNFVREFQRVQERLEMRLQRIAKATPVIKRLINERVLLSERDIAREAVLEGISAKQSIAQLEKINGRAHPVSETLIDSVWPTVELDTKKRILAQFAEERSLKLESEAPATTQIPFAKEESTILNEFLDKDVDTLNQKVKAQPKKTPNASGLPVDSVEYDNIVIDNDIFKKD